MTDIEPIKKDEEPGTWGSYVLLEQIKEREELKRRAQQATLSIDEYHKAMGLTK